MVPHPVRIAKEEDKESVIIGGLSKESTYLTPEITINNNTSSK